ncbi:hypothetical protein [Treponema sp. UBA3813]|uniref:tetratricopeptide repeat protein n=1 Tax=Treponema sp. UBA3813 TaxID=1947715 RepID=UPI0025FA2F16|nr:hypothetical protein [Treponema sp. UBA3813]
MKKAFFYLILSCLFFLSCSSAPKRAMLVTDNSQVAYSQLEDANNSIVSGKYSRAYNLLASAYSLALSVDNTDLLCKVTLSGIVFKILCPDISEIIPAAERQTSVNEDVFLLKSKDEILAESKKLANRSSNPAFFSKLCSIYETRIFLENELAASDTNSISSDSCRSYLSVLESVRPLLKKEPYYHAYLYRTEGDVCMAAGMYDAAQKNFAEAARIHTNDRYLVEIGLDWYCLARAYSLGGKKSDAISAIQSALKYDKDAENTSGIASDYIAYSKILLKDNPTDEEKKLSEELALWGEKILNARN